MYVIPVDHRGAARGGVNGWLSVEAFDMQYGAERIAKASVEYLQKIIV